jgi:hypothetical protein
MLDPYPTLMIPRTVCKNGQPFVVRKWLNPDPELHGFVGVTETGLCIADCSRQVTLDFGMWVSTREELDREMRARIYKLQVLVNACAQMRANLDVSYPKRLKDLKERAALIAEKM